MPLDMPGLEPSIISIKEWQGDSMTTHISLNQDLNADREI